MRILWITWYSLTNEVEVESGYSEGKPDLSSIKGTPTS